MSDDFYHDDPIEETSHTKSRFKFLTTGAIIVGSIFYFQSTLAGNISLNSGSGVEFGQGVSQAVACSGNTNLTLTPSSTFTNVADSTGAHYLSSVTVSNIPDSCFGADFTINAYSDSEGTPLALFETSTTSAVIYNNAGTFSRGTGSTGMTVASSTGAFTATFTVPVAQSSNVFKLTIQSGANTPYYEVGWTGPGGGFVYYVDNAGFDCGPTFTARCKYLEAAPNLWSGAADPFIVWAVSANQSADVSGITNESSANNSASGVGLGYKNSLAIVTQNGAYSASSNRYAAGAARAYAGGSKSDWYLPTTAELTLLCQWNRGVAPSVTTACTGGSRNSATYGAGAAGITADDYFSSSEISASNARGQWLGTDTILINKTKNFQGAVRPIRAF